MAGKAMVLVDGENLLLRFEEMKGSGRSIAAGVIHEPGKYVWHTDVTGFRAWDLLRVSYYTTCVGDDKILSELSTALSRVKYIYLRPSRLEDYGFVVPRVFKKPSRSQKSASVDINIAIDMLRHVHMRQVECLLLLTGDGDYIPLIQEAMRQGTVVYVGAFSSGLHPTIPMIADEFVDLDTRFFGGQ